VNQYSGVVIATAVAVTCDADGGERGRLRRHRVARHFREQDEDRITRRMGLMMGDVELPDAKREVDRVEIFERRRKIRKVKCEKNGRKDDDQRRTR
jgi:hypothetical protein